MGIIQYSILNISTCPWDVFYGCLISWLHVLPTNALWLPHEFAPTVCVQVFSPSPHPQQSKERPCAEHWGHGGREMVTTALLSRCSVWRRKACQQALRSLSPQGMMCPWPRGECLTPSRGFSGPVSWHYINQPQESSQALTHAPAFTGLSGNHYSRKIQFRHKPDFVGDSWHRPQTPMDCHPLSLGRFSFLCAEACSTYTPKPKGRPCEPETVSN